MSAVVHDPRFFGLRRAAFLCLAATITVLVGFSVVLESTKLGLPAPVFGVGAVAVVWLALTKRRGVALAAVLLYLGLLDGFLKLKTGGTLATLGRDVFLYVVAAGMALRARGPFRIPPLTGWVVAWIAVFVVQVANPGNYSLGHAIASLRQDVEFVPLFFIGFAALRTHASLHAFFALVLAVAAINGAVAAYQGSLSPSQLATWGPGYSEFASSRTYVGADGTGKVRPPALGGDEGFGGVLGATAIPGGIVLLIAYRRRKWLLALIVLGLIGAGIGVLTSQSRSAVLMTIVSLMSVLGLIAVGRQAQRALIAAIAIGALAFAAVQVTGAFNSSAFYRYSSISPGQATSTIYSSRASTWKTTGKYLVTKPFGAGLGQVGPAAAKAGGTGNLWNAESQFNYLIIEGGIPALALFLLFLGALFAVTIRGLRRERDPHTVTVLAAVAAPLFCYAAGMFYGVITTEPPDAPYLWLAAGVISWWLVGRHQTPSIDAPNTGLTSRAPQTGPREVRAGSIVPPAILDDRHPTSPTPAYHRLSSASAPVELPPIASSPGGGPAPSAAGPHAWTSPNLVNDYGRRFVAPGWEAKPSPHAPPTDQVGATTVDSELTDGEIATAASRGAVATVVRNALVMLLQAGSSLIVARLIDPRSYGILGLALTLVGALRYLGDLGITFRVAVLRRIDDDDLRRALGIGLATAGAGALLISVIWQFLPLVQTATAGSRLVAPVLAATLVITAVTKPATALLSRRLAFRAIANTTLLSTVVFFATQIPLLVAGLRIWAIVIAYVVSSVVNAVLLLIAARGLPAPSLRGPIWREIRLSFPYQAPIVAQAAVAVIVSVLVASLLGAHGVGLFSWSTVLATPITTIVFTLEGVIAPSLARMLRDDGARFSQATDVVLLTFAALAAVAAGASIGLVPDVVRFVFGVKWLPAVGAVQMALIGVVPTSLVAGCASIVNSQDRPGGRLRASLAAGATAVVLTVPLTLAAGVTGAAAVAYVISPIVEALVLASYAGARIPFLVFRIARIALPAAALSVVLGHFTTSRLSFAAAVLIAAIAGLFVLAATERDLVRTLIRQVSRRPSLNL